MRMDGVDQLATSPSPLFVLWIAQDEALVTMGTVIVTGTTLDQHVRLVAALIVAPTTACVMLTELVIV